MTPPSRREPGSGTVLAVTGLIREARIAAGPGVTALAIGGDRTAFERKLARLEVDAISAAVSFGLAGGLDPDLAVGDLLIATGIVHGERAFPTSTGLRETLAGRLSHSGEAHRLVTFAGVDAPILDRDGKSRLRSSSEADAVDMESHIVAEFAAAHGLPFVALRVISDGAGDVLPVVASTAMRPDGSVDIWRVLRGTARDPSQIPALIETGRNAAAAFRRLRRVRRLLGRGLGLDL